MTRHDASDLAQPVSAGRPRRCAAIISTPAVRQGNYWLVGDVRNTPGRSMFVRLKGRSGEGRGGQMDRRRHGRTWRPARRHPGGSCGLVDFADVAGRGAALPEPAASRT